MAVGGFPLSGLLGLSLVKYPIKKFLSRQKNQSSGTMLKVTDQLLNIDPTSRAPRDILGKELHVRNVEAN